MGIIQLTSPAPAEPVGRRRRPVLAGPRRSPPAAPPQVGLPPGGLELLPAQRVDGEVQSGVDAHAQVGDLHYVLGIGKRRKQIFMHSHGQKFERCLTCMAPSMGQSLLPRILVCFDKIYYVENVGKRCVSHLAPPHVSTSYRSGNSFGAWHTMNSIDIAETEREMWEVKVCKLIISWAVAQKNDFAYLTKPMTSFTQRDFFAFTKGCEGGSEESSFSA